MPVGEIILEIPRSKGTVDGKWDMLRVAEANKWAVPRK
jgi:hypothetical protein